MVMKITKGLRVLPAGVTFSNFFSVVKGTEESII